MDIRKTLIVSETFRKILLDLFNAKSKAALLYDDHGMTRAEDFIKEFREDGEESYIILENGQKIFINNIIAVNGTFLSQYSEC
jgi:hypothetical protein